MKTYRRILSLLAAAVLLLSPLAPARASGTDEPDSALRVRQRMSVRVPKIGQRRLQPPDIPRPQDAPEEPSDRYEALELSPEDRELLARLVWLEARGEPWEGQVAVAEVVLNRMLSPEFPDTLSEVLYQPGQFTPARRLSSTRAEETQYEAVEEAVYGRECVLAADVVYFSAVPCNSRVRAVIGGHSFCAL